MGIMILRKLIIIVISLCNFYNVTAQNLPARKRKIVATNIAELQNPISVQYLKQNLGSDNPKLILNHALEKNLKEKLKNDAVVKNMYESIRLSAEKILDEPLLKREMEGKRLLYVSWEMLYRMNMLGMVYRIEKDEAVLNRINDEIIAVCNFSDWNPSHFLDVAEMSLAIALAVDWTAGDLSESTMALAKSSLIEKGIIPSYEKSDDNWWIKSKINWNPVCHAGMIAAAIVIAEEDPDLAAKTISRALEKLPLALNEYSPDGAYPEGSSYWRYGTGYAVLIAAMLESAFGSDFGISEFPGFMESAYFRTMSNAPSGQFYNFADCADKRDKNGDIILAWFASKAGNKLFFESKRFLNSPETKEKLYRNTGAGLVWMAQYSKRQEKKLATSWKGGGANPIVIFSDKNDTTHHYYFGGKGGSASVNHGNMDAGSFVFELNDIRWVVDPGVQPYYELEKTGFNLWDTCQNCQRWTLLTKNNFGHSTLTINNEKHWVEGKAEIVDFKSGENPEATINLTPVFNRLLERAQRKFKKDSPNSLLIEDEIIPNKETKLVTWQLMTTADVEITNGGVILKQNNKHLYLENISHPEIQVAVVSLDPPPLILDRHIAGLKRIEIRIPVTEAKGEAIKIKVRLREHKI